MKTISGNIKKVLSIETIRSSPQSRDTVPFSVAAVFFPFLQYTAEKTSNAKEKKSTSTASNFTIESRK